MGIANSSIKFSLHTKADTTAVKSTAYHLHKMTPIESILVYDRVAEVNILLTLVDGRKSHQRKPFAESDLEKGVLYAFLRATSKRIVKYPSGGRVFMASTNPANMTSIKLERVICDEQLHPFASKQHIDAWVKGTLGMPYSEYRTKMMHIIYAGLLDQSIVVGDRFAQLKKDVHHFFFHTPRVSTPQLRHLLHSAEEHTLEHWKRKLLGALGVLVHDYSDGKIAQVSEETGVHKGTLTRWVADNELDTVLKRVQKYVPIHK